MLLLGKTLESINETDLKALVQNEVAEGKTIEYKLELPKNADKSKKEFLADISSFANSTGGHIVYGVKANEGIARELTGLEIANIDSEKLRLENIIRDGIEPRITGLKIHPVKLQNTKSLIIIEIPKSWAMPHMVVFQGHSRFFSRNSAGKYQLDITELRALFALSESIGKQIKNFRLERLSKIIAGETPVLPDDVPKIIFHLIPFNAFDASNNLDIASIEIGKLNLRPIYAGGWSHRYNLDGYMTFSKDSAAATYTAYTQLFRSGIIEAVECSLFERIDGKKFIPHKVFEYNLIGILGTYLETLQKAGVQTPLVTMLTLVGVHDYFMPNQPTLRYINKIDRDILQLPEVIIESYDEEPSKIMKPIFDAIWNAAGFSCSMNYDEEGNWKYRD